MPWGLDSKNGGYGHHLQKLMAGDFISLSDSGVKLPGTGMHHAKLVSEPGLYKLVMRSNKPEAVHFQQWVTAEVLPTIRKTGGYMAPSVANMVETDSEQFLARAVLIAQGGPAVRRSRVRMALSGSTAHDRHQSM